MSKEKLVNWYHESEPNTSTFQKLVANFKAHTAFHIEAGWNEGHDDGGDGTRHPRSRHEIAKSFTEEDKDGFDVNCFMDEFMRTVYPRWAVRQFARTSIVSDKHRSAGYCPLVQFPSSFNIGNDPTPDHIDEVYFDGAGNCIVVSCVRGDGLLWFRNLKTKAVHCALVEEGDIYFFRGGLRLTCSHGVANMKEVDGLENTDRITFTKRYGFVTKAERLTYLEFHQPIIFRAVWNERRPVRYLTGDKQWVTVFPFTACSTPLCKNRHVISRDLVCKRCKSQLRPHCGCKSSRCIHDRSIAVRDLLTCERLKNISVKHFTDALVEMIKKFPYGEVFHEYEWNMYACVCCMCLCWLCLNAVASQLAQMSSLTFHVYCT